VTFASAVARRQEHRDSLRQAVGDDTILRCASTGLCSKATPTVIGARRSTICLIAPCSRSTAVIGRRLLHLPVRCSLSMARTPTPRISSRPLTTPVRCEDSQSCLSILSTRPSCPPAWNPRSTVCWAVQRQRKHRLRCSGRCGPVELDPLEHLRGKFGRILAGWPPSLGGHWAPEFSPSRLAPYNRGCASSSVVVEALAVWACPPPAAAHR